MQFHRAPPPDRRQYHRSDSAVYNYVRFYHTIHGYNFVIIFSVCCLYSRETLVSQICHVEVEEDHIHLIDPLIQHLRSSLFISHLMSPTMGMVMNMEIITFATLNSTTLCLSILTIMMAITMTVEENLETASKHLNLAHTIILTMKGIYQSHQIPNHIVKHHPEVTHVVR